jgi:hypothetical protein
VNGNKPDLAALAVDAKVHDAFTALQALRSSRHSSSRRMP